MIYAFAYKKIGFFFKNKAHLQMMLKWAYKCDILEYCLRIICRLQSLYLTVWLRCLRWRFPGDLPE